MILIYTFSLTTLATQIWACCLSNCAESPLANIQYAPPAGTTYYRCNTAGSSICRVGGCKSGESQIPSTLTFTNLTKCVTYLKYVMCNDSPTYLCTTDIPGCSGLGTRFGTATYDTSIACQRAFPSGTFYRCLNSGGISCVAAPATCGNNYLTQPTGIAYSSQTTCESYVGKVRCYDPTTNSYSCVDDDDAFPPCPSGHTQISNSLDETTCSSFSATSFARCATTAGVTCRPAGRVTWTESSSQDTSFLEYAPLTGACLANENVIPQGVTFTSAQCTAHRRFLECYRWTANTWACSEDYACLADPDTAVINEYPSTSTSCPATPHVPSAFVRCTKDGARICRPISPGCSASESQVPSSRTFTTQAYCESYPAVADKWIRCKSTLNLSPYCIFAACRDGDERIALSGSTVEFSSEAACNAAKFQGQICYEARSAGAFAITTTFDHSTTACSTGQRLMDTWLMANTESALQSLAISYYATDTNPIGHYRCLSSASKPVCRPDMDITTAPPDCGSSETLITTPTAALNTLADCKASLYLAKPCYRALKNAEPYYAISAALDTSSGCAQGTELELEATYQSGSSQDSAITAAITRGTTLYATDATHYRCKVTNSMTSELVPVCRPDMGDNDCPTGEEKLITGAGSWSNLASCQATRYFAKPCYEPLRFENSPNKFYTIEPAYDTDGNCETGQLELSATYADYGPLKPVSVAAREALLDALAHIRCGNGDGVSIAKTPICRPKMTMAEGNTNSALCAFTLNAESPLTTSINGETEWIGLNACNAVRYVAKPCYRAISIGPDYYSIVPGYDTAPTGGCSSNEADITLGFITPSSSADLPNYDPTLYTNIASGLPHSRCKLGPGSPICRPDMDGSTPELDCADGIDNDTIILQQPDTLYDSYAACMSQRWWARACYAARTSELEPGSGQYYALQPRYDHSALQTCGAGQFEVSEQWFKVELTPPDFSTLHATINALPHQRCKRSTSAFCRPDMSTSVNNTNAADNPCAIGETLLTTSIGGTTTWPTMAACNAVRFAAVACYVPQITTQALPFSYFYSVTAAFDTDTTTTCTTGRVLLVDQQLTAANREDISYEAVADHVESLPHYRCRYSASVVACRPDMTLAVGNDAIPASPRPGKCSHWRSETQLNIQRDAYPTQADCRSDTNTYYIPCYYRYHVQNYIDLTTPSFNKDTFSGTTVFRCVTDAAGCPSNYVQLPFDTKNVDFTDTTSCDNYKQTIDEWVLCRKTVTGSSSFTYAMCRPATFGCDPANDETLVDSFSTGSSPFSSVSNCLGAVTSASERSRCCCSKSGSRIPCGALVSTGTYGNSDFLITACDCSGCTPAGSWNPTSGTAGRFYLYSSDNNAC